jgi:hypothetical protein
MANPYRAFRQLERWLFRGVPEHPEPTWQRDFNALVRDRQTGKSQLSYEPSRRPKGRRIVTIIYRPDVEEIEYVYEADGKKPNS